MIAHRNNNRRRILSDRRAAPRERDRAYALNEMATLSDAQFQRMFRLNRAAFYHLLNLIHEEIAPRLSLNHNFHNSKKEISPETRLAVTLRWLAGGSYLDICFAFGISISTFFEEEGVVWPTILAIENNLSISLDVSDTALLSSISKGFATYCHGRIHGCIMAIDGLVIRTRAPTAKEVFNQSSYRNRKGTFGIVIMAGCDHMCRFTMFSPKFNGATNDSLA